mgnify:CR=1 FL=1
MLTDQMPIAASIAAHDGGVTWEKVLFRNNDVGAIDLNFDPDEFANHLCRTLERAPATLVYLCAGQRTRRRHL